MSDAREPYPSDVSDDEGASVASYLALLPEAAGQRRRRLRELIDGLRCVVKNGIVWRAMPNDPPPWAAVHQRAARRLRAGCFEQLAQDLRVPRRAARPSPRRRRARRQRAPVRARGRRPRRWSLSSGRPEAGPGGRPGLHRRARRRRGPSPRRPARGRQAAREAKRGFVLLPRRWVVERSLAWATAWAARCRRLARDSERPPETLAGPHLVALACLMLRRAAEPGPNP